MWSALLMKGCGYYLFLQLVLPMGSKTVRVTQIKNVFCVCVCVCVCGCTLSRLREGESRLSPCESVDVLRTYFPDLNTNSYKHKINKLTTITNKRATIHKGTMSCMVSKETQTSHHLSLSWCCSPLHLTLSRCLL